MKKRRRDRSNEVVCRCGAYRFPHRMTGGKCGGSAWAERYYREVTKLCRNCHCNRGYECEVAVGLEDAAQCEGLADALHSGVDPFVTLMSKMKEQENDRPCVFDRGMPPTSEASGIRVVRPLLLGPALLETQGRDEDRATPAEAEHPAESYAAPVR